MAENTPPQQQQRVTFGTRDAESHRRRQLHKKLTECKILVYPHLSLAMAPSASQRTASAPQPGPATGRRAAGPLEKGPGTRCATRSILSDALAHQHISNSTRRLGRFIRGGVIAAAHMRRAVFE